MTGSDWKHPHIVLLAAASVLAFGGGYFVGGRSAGPADGVPPIVIGNDLATAPGSRARPDENTLVAENAEQDESVNRARPEAAEPAERPPEARQEPRPEARPEPRPAPRPRPRDPDPDFNPGDRDDPDLIDPDTLGEKPE